MPQVRQHWERIRDLHGFIAQCTSSGPSIDSVQGIENYCKEIMNELYYVTYHLQQRNAPQIPFYTPQYDSNTPQPSFSASSNTFPVLPSNKSTPNWDFNHADSSPLYSLPVLPSTLESHQTPSAIDTAFASCNSHTNSTRLSNRKSCTLCGVTETPEWRKGPSGKTTLCNACGLSFARKEKKEREYLSGLGYNKDDIKNIMKSTQSHLYSQVQSERQEFLFSEFHNSDNPANDPSTEIDNEVVFFS